MMQRILVWDLPTRIFHWALALSFTGAYLTAEAENWRNLHVLLGYTVLGLLTFRIVWGFVGSRYARFAEFLRGPKSVLHYASALLAGRPQHFVGHNPLGSLAILLMIGLGMSSGVSGWLLDSDVGGEAMEEIHEVLSNGMLIVVCLHVAGVVYGSIIHRENLVTAMITGMKRGTSAEGINHSRAWIAVALVVMVSGFWVANGFGLGGSVGPESGESRLDHNEASDDDDD